MCGEIFRCWIWLRASNPPGLAFHAKSGGIAAAMKVIALASGRTPKCVGILGFDGVSLLDLAGPLEAFAAARMDAPDGKAQPCYEARIIGVTGKTFASESGLVFKTSPNS